jgi:hypothetical protein
MGRLRHVLLILLALVLLFEAWLWSKLAPVVAFVVAMLPLARLKAGMAAALAGLSPTATLLVFIVPVLLLLPLKFLGLYMLAHGFWLGALGVLALAKLMSVGVTAFIFEITRPKLLQMAWFRRFYELVLGGLAWAHALTDPVKLRLKIAMRRMRRWLRILAPQRAGRTLKLFGRIRRRIQSARAAA